MNNKLLMGALAGAVTSFLLGWIIYGMFMMDYMNENSMPGFNRNEADMVWWAMIVSNLGWGLMSSLVVGKWAGNRNLMSGMQTGAIFGLVLAFTYDLGFWAYSNLFTNMNVMFVDIAVSTVMMAIVGGVVAWVWGMGKAA